MVSGQIMYPQDEAIETLIHQATNEAQRLQVPVAIVNRYGQLMHVNLTDALDRDAVIEIIRPVSKKW